MMYKFKADEKIIVEKIAEDKDIDFNIYDIQTKAMRTINGAETITVKHKGSKVTFEKNMFHRNFEEV